MTIIISVLFKYRQVILLLTGGRQSADIVNWLKKKTGPSAIKLEDVSAANKMIEKEEVVVIGYFKVGLKRKKR